MPIKSSLSKFERMAYQTQSPDKNFIYSDRKAAGTAESWDPRGSAGGSADAGSAENLPTSVLVPETNLQSSNFRIRNTRGRRRKYKKGTGSQMKMMRSPEPVGEYGYVTAQQVQNLNVKSRESLQEEQKAFATGNVPDKNGATADVRVSQDQNPLNEPSVDASKNAANNM